MQEGLLPTEASISPFVLFFTVVLGDTLVLTLHPLSQPCKAPVSSTVLVIVHGPIVLHSQKIL